MTDIAIAFGLPSYRFTYTYGSNLHAAPPSLGSASADWERARDEAQHSISSALWPEFNRDAPAVPRAARQNDLLIADLRILKMLRPSGQHWFESALTRGTAGRAPFGSAAARVLFRCEDASYPTIGFDVDGRLATFNTGFVTFSDFVNKIVTEAERMQLYALVTEAGRTAAMSKGIDWINQSLKCKFQRSRPHQVAYEAREDDFEYELSHTCHSPSMPSGHCLQAAAHALLAHESIAGHAIWGAYVHELPAWAATVGDRRNCAGLHFPSDNWASWITLATVLPLLFPHASKLADAKIRLSTIITSSLCYQLAARMPEFGDALARLTALGIPNLQPLD